MRQRSALARQRGIVTRAAAAPSMTGRHGTAHLLAACLPGAAHLFGCLHHHHHHHHHHPQGHPEVGRPGPQHSLSPPSALTPPLPPPPHTFTQPNPHTRACACARAPPSPSAPQMCDILARSMKEYERRPMDRHGFSELPGDCLSFKYLRDVSSSRGRSRGGSCRGRAAADQRLLDRVGPRVGRGRHRRFSWLPKDNKFRSVWRARATPESQPGSL